MNNLKTMIAAVALFGIALQNQAQTPTPVYFLNALGGTGSGTTTASITPIIAPPNSTYLTNYNPSATYPFIFTNGPDGVPNEATFSGDNRGNEALMGTIGAMPSVTNAVTFTLWVQGDAGYNNQKMLYLSTNVPPAVTSTGSGNLLNIALNGTGPIQVGVNGSTSVQSSAGVWNGAVYAQNTWYFVAVVYTGTAGNGCYIYTGGPNTPVAQQANLTVGAGMSKAAFNYCSTNPFSIAVGNEPQGTRSWPGYIDDVNIYSGTLSLPQLEAIRYTQGMPTNAPPEAVAFAVSPGTTVFGGTPLTLTLLAGGQYLAYQWQTDGGSGNVPTNIPNATMATLAVTPANLAAVQNIVYSCIVSNTLGGGAVSTNVTVTVNPANPYVWSGGDAPNNTWADGLNWVGGQVPVANAPVIFAGGLETNVNMESSYTVGGLSFSNNAGAFIITNTANTLTLASGSLVANNSTNAATLGVPVLLDGLVNLNPAAGNLLFTNAISEAVAGAGALTTAGSGISVLAGVSTYTGNTTISSGTLQVADPGQLGGGVYAGAMVDNGTFNYSSSAAQALTGLISGTGGLTLNSPNGTILTLNGAAVPEAYTGPTIVNGGELDLSFNNAAASGIYASSGLTINSRGTVKLLADNNLAGSATAIGTLPVIINAGGLLTSAPRSSHIRSVLTLNGGTLDDAGGILTAYGSWDLDAGVAVNSGPNNGVTSTIAALTVIPSQAGGTVFNVANGGTTSGVDLDVTGTLINGTALADTGIIKTGNGTMRLDGVNTYVGPTTISAGTLILADPGQLGAGSYAANITNNGAFISTTTAGQTLSGVISGAGSLAVGGSANSALTLAGANNYTGNTVISNGTLFLEGSISNSPNIIIGAGAVFDVSAVNSYTLGANQNLFGSGTVNGSVNAALGSAIYAGPAGGFGTNAFNGNLNLAFGATCYFNLGAAYNGQNGSLVVNGALTDNGFAYINAPSASANLDISQDYVLITTSGGVSGTVSATPLWGVKPLNGSEFTVGVSGKNVVLHYSPALPPTIATATASPATVAHGASVLISVTVAPGTGTVNPNTGVSLNASQVGLSSAVPLMLSSVPNVYTNTIVIPAGTAVQSYTLPVAVTDSTPLIGTAGIALTVLQANEVWDGLAAPDNTWANALNWANDVVPAAGDLVTFAGTAHLTADMESSYSVAALDFAANAGSFIITNVSGTLTLTGSVTNNSPNLQTLGVPVNLGGTLIMDAAAGNLAFTNVLADDVNDGLTGGVIASGTNTVTLAGNNTYSGPTLINAGTMVLSGNNTSASGPVTNNATLQLDEFAASGNNPLGGGVLALSNGSTLQLRSDASVMFTPASLALPNAADTLNFDVGPLTAGVMGQTLTFNNPLAFTDSQANQTINVTGTNGYTLALGDITAVSATTHNPYQMVAINVVPEVTVQLASFTTGNWGDYLSFSGGGNAVFAGTFSNTSDGSGILTINGGTTVTFTGQTVKNATGDSYSYLVQNGTLVVDNSAALINNTDGTADNNISFFNLGPATNVVSPGSTSLPTGFQTVTTNNSVNCALYLGDANNSTGGFTVAPNVTLNVSDGDLGFTNSGVMTIGGQNTSGVNAYQNNIVLGWTANRGKSATLVAATGGEVDFAGSANNLGILANGTDQSAGITVGAPGFAGLVKLGETNTYYGPTIVNYGTLALANVNGFDAYIGNSADIVIQGGALLDVSLQNSQALPLGTGAIPQMMQGSGSLKGNLAVGSLGTVAPGTATTLGTLTVSNNVTLGGNLVLKLNNLTGPNNDKLVVKGTLTTGGTLTVTNIGPALVAGNTFQLFPSGVTGFSQLILPVSDNNYKYTWTTNLAASGSITLQSVTPLVNTNAATANFRGVPGANNTLQFTWAADHQGWQLYTNIVGLTAPGSWYPMAGSSNGTSATITINPAQPQVFFQLRYP